MTKVMIVDDSLFMRNHFAKLLSKNGYEIITAGDGEEAIQVYGEQKPDVVLMDITMPRKTGLQAIDEIRESDPLAKIIVVTALDQRSMAVRAIQIGAKDFLAKPVLSRQLLAALEKVLK